MRKLPPREIEEKGVGLEEIAEAKKIAFRFLSYRMRSCQEVEDKLKIKGFPPNIIDTVIKDLKRIGYLNDSEFAKTFIESRILHNPKGRSFLLYELLKKGIDKEIAEGVLDEKLPSDEEEKFARLLAEKVWKKKRNLDEDKRKVHTYSYLARRGFLPSLIQRIVENLDR